MEDQKSEDFAEIISQSQNFIKEIQQVKTRLDLLKAGNTLSALNYSLLEIIRKDENEALHMINDILSEKDAK